MTRKLSLLALFLSMAIVSGGAGENPGGRAFEPWDPDRPWQVIDLAIALDTSGSMEPLIDSARIALWEIVNDLTKLEPTPLLRVAIISYGSSDYDAKTGRVRIDTDFTQDFDLASERLFALVTGKNGGAEYVGRALQVALDGLDWTRSEDTLKILLVAGNEPADQDPKIQLEAVTAKFLQEGIFLHAIYWGSEEHQHAQSWMRLAEFAESPLVSINLGNGTARLKTPVDEQLAELSEAINETYIPLGEAGFKRQKSLAQQDENAKTLNPAAAASRAQAKASPLYCAGWDLVDALETGRLTLYELDTNQLPEPLRTMSQEELELYVEETRVRREELRDRIAELGRSRRQYVTEQMRAQGVDPSQTFDAAVIDLLRERLERQGFEVPEY